MRTKEETIVIDLPIETVKTKINDALVNGGFSDIHENSLINEYRAKFHSFTTWGEIQIIYQEVSEKTELKITTKAKVDNIYTLFRSPNSVIRNAFVDNLK